MNISTVSLLATTLSGDTATERITTESSSDLPTGLPTIIQGSGFDQMCSDFNIGTESFDVCGGIVLRIGSAAFAAFLLISSIMLMKYTVNDKKREELKENRLNKLKAHKGTWLLLIITLMFEHYQLATWLVLFWGNAVVKLYAFCTYFISTPCAWMYLYRVEKYHANPAFLLGHVIYAMVVSLVNYITFVSFLAQATAAPDFLSMDVRFIMSGLALLAASTHTALCLINVFIPRYSIRSPYSKLSLDDDEEEEQLSGSPTKEEDLPLRITYDDDPFPEQLILWFVGPILWEHRKDNTFTKNDLGRLPEKFDPIKYSVILWKVFLAHPNMQRHARLLWAMFRACLMPILGSFGLMLIVECITLAPPLMLGTMINFVENGGTKTENPMFLTMSEAIINGYMVCSFMINIMAGRSILSTYAQLIKKNAVVNAFTTLQYCVGQKVLKMENLKQNISFSQGKIINLISQDVKKTTIFLNFIPGYIIIPTKFVAIAWIMRQVIGEAVYIALPVSMVLYLAQIAIIRLTVKFRKERLQVLDGRNTEIKNMFSVIRLLKLYNLTDVYRKKLSDLRDADILIGTKLAVLGSITQVIGGCYSMVFLVTLFIVYWIMYGQIMDTGMVFMSLGLIMSLKKNLMNLSKNLTSAGKCWVSLDRIVEFFSMKEVCGLPGSNKKNIEYYTKFKDDTLVITNASFQLMTQDDNVLRNINLSVPRGKLTVILGPVGCGKSSLLSAMLGELTKTSGNVIWLDPADSVGLVSQVPWIFQGTLRENVIMGTPFDDLRYSRVVKACQLIEDIDTLPQGDQSEIGTKGATLSGGQKQRVALARTMYSKTQTILLDDPFSALDNKVAGLIFLRGLKQLLLKTGRTVVLVTSSQGYAKEADHVVIMTEGEIEAQGKHTTLEEKGYVFDSNSIPGARVSRSRGGGRGGKGNRGSSKRSQSRDENSEKEVEGSETKRGGGRGGNRGSSRSESKQRPETQKPPGWENMTAEQQESYKTERDERMKSGNFMQLTFHTREDGSKYCVTEIGSELQCNADGTPVNSRGESFIKTEAGVWMPPRAARKLDTEGSYGGRGESKGGRGESKGGRGGRGGGGGGRKERKDRKIKSGDARKGKLIKEETILEGIVTRSVYMRYLQDYKFGVFSLALILIIANMVIQTVSVMWLTMWTSTNRAGYLESDRHHNGSNFENSTLELLNGTSDTGTFGYSRQFHSNESVMLSNQSGLFQHYYNNSNHGALASKLMDGLYHIHGNDSNSTSIISEFMKPDEETGMDQVYTFFTSKPTAYYIYVYVSIVLCAIFSNVINRIYVKLMCFKLSKRMFMRMMDTQFNATSRYYDETVVGRIINRFTMDINNAEESGVKSILQLITGILANLKFVIMQLFVSWYVILFYFPAFYIVFQLQNMQLQTSRQNRRISAALRTPVMEKINNIIESVTSIRAFGVEKEKLGEFNAALRNNACSRLWGVYFSSWISLYISFISVFFVGFASLMSISACLAGYVHPALMGIALLYTFQVTRQVSGLTSRYAQLEQNFSAVERLYQMEDETPQEVDNPTAIPRPNWPQYGFIKVKGLKARYDDELDDVLHGLTFDICAGHKIGVCGRTGSGKSSFGLTLLRMLPIREGSITIDGININEISLAKLRDTVTIIPQEPILFQGTIRKNLDVTGYKTDEELWTALEIALVKDFVSDLPDGLDTVLVDEGENISKGQRQLICFARAFLRNTRIFILDEATAALDAETDQRIQRVIADRFKQCTVITVAHRINTIVDSDMILGLENGKIMEYDTPQNLLSSEKSMFKRLVNMSLS